ncbi:purine nucleoside phosphorylase 5a [Syncephalis plumigaleata]|nr:purine nucleoside phosphorylase 5a [Syncephalis plumigaleata]
MVTTLTVQEAVDHILSTLPVHAIPKVGIVCGSGLGGLGAQLTDTTTYDYHAIPGFPVSTVSGHAGKLVFGEYGGQRVVCHEVASTAFPIRVMRRLGVETLLVTNAAGGLHPKWNVGDFALVYDHLALPSLAGLSALRGKNDADFGPRFPGMTDAYPVDLRRLAVEAANDIDSATMGVYCYVGGPSYETPAEARALRSLGGDLVGMSTVPEVIVANHCGMRVLAISLVTNRVRTSRGELALPTSEEIKAAEAFEDDSIDAPTHEEVLATAASRAKDLERWVKRIMEKL